MLLLLAKNSKAGCSFWQNFLKLSLKSKKWNTPLKIFKVPPCGLDTTFMGKHEGQDVMCQNQIPMGLIDESQQIQAAPQKTVILQSDTELEYEDEISEEDFEIKNC